MTRKKKLLYNTVFSLAYQGVAVLSGFLVPRYLLVFYGSEVNGLLVSIGQFLGFIGLAEMGIGAVVRSALYRPLAENDSEAISRILLSARRFYHKMAFLLIVYTALVAWLYPRLTQSSFDALFTAGCVVIIAFSLFIQYYFSISYVLLLDADALAFIPFAVRSVLLLVNIVVSILLMQRAVDIRAVQLASSVIFLIQPLVYHVYVKKHYRLPKIAALQQEPIPQKWNGLAQHISYVVLCNTDTVVLTLFSTLKNVSVYAVYMLMTTGVKQIVLALTAGMQALLGNLLARNETKTLHKTFSFFEWALHTGTVFLFTCTSILIVPFVAVYTKGIDDVSYLVPLFGMLLTAAWAVYCIRLPYNIMVLAAGHYRQTQWSCVLEMAINIIVSTLLVLRWGLVGVALGTLGAMSYRTGYLAWYLSHAILYRPLRYFFKHCCVDVVMIVSMVISTLWIQSGGVNYIDWTKQAIQVTCIGILVCLLINVIFYKEHCIFLYREVSIMFHKIYRMCVDDR